MTLQAGISAEKLAARIGSTMQVLVDGYDDQGRLVGRSYADAPEIDGCVYINTGEECVPGDMLNVTITAADNYDLYGESE